MLKSIWHILLKTIWTQRRATTCPLMATNNKNMWAALLEKGYKGLHKYGQFMTPKKKTVCCDLDSDNKKEQQN